MGGKAPKYPMPTAQEMDLQSEQANLLRLQTQQMQDSAAQQAALSPYLYKQLGLTPSYDETGKLTFTTDPQFDQQQQLMRDYQLAQAQYGTESIEAQRALLPLQQKMAEAQLGMLPLQTEALRSQLELQGQQSKYNLQQQRLQELLQPQMFEEMGLRAQRDAAGNIVGFEEIPDSLRSQQEEIQRLQQERSLAALKGELPVDPALMRDLGAREDLTRETLRRQLGPGYFTSTPGTETLGRFEEARAMTLDAARRGDLTLAEQLGISRGNANLMQDQYRTGLMQGVRPGSFAQAATLGGALGGNIGGLGGGGGGGMGFGAQSPLLGLAAAGAPQGGYEGLYSGFNQVMGNLGQWRGNKFQADVTAYQGKQAENQMYAQLGGTAVAAGATAAIVAAGAVVLSSRMAKRNIGALSKADEARTLAELIGEV